MPTCTGNVYVSPPSPCMYTPSPATPWTYIRSRHVALSFKNLEVRRFIQTEPHKIYLSWIAARFGLSVKQLLQTNPASLFLEHFHTLTWTQKVACKKAFPQLTFLTSAPHNILIRSSPYQMLYSGVCWDTRPATWEQTLRKY